MRIINKSRIPSRYHGSVHQCKTFPAFELLPSGRWLAGWKAAEKKTDAIHKTAQMTWSDDQGATWVPAFEPVKLPNIEGKPGQVISLYFLSLGGDRVLMVLNWVDESRPDLPFYDPKDESLKDTRIFYCFSENGGESWSDPLLMDTSGVGGPVPLTGPPIRLGDGSVLCQFEVNKYKGDPNKWIHRSAMIRSLDNGITWKNPTIVTNIPDMYYWDQRPNVLLDGTTLVNYFWTLDGKKNTYLNIHESKSIDGGNTWSQPMDTGIYGQPGRPVQLQDGRIACVSIDRTSLPVITIWIKEGLNEPFSVNLEVHRSAQPRQDSQKVSMNEAWQEMAAFSVGHPNLLYLGGTEVLAYYYAGLHHDCTDICYAHISLEKNKVKTLNRA